MNKKFLLRIFVALLLLTAISCKTTYNVTRKEAVSIAISDTNGVDSAIIKIIQPYSDKIKGIMEEVIGYSDATYEKGQPEGTLGNFLCDLLIDFAQNKYGEFVKETSVMCLLNNGGIRSSLPIGEVKVETIYQIMPFDNTVVLIELKGIVLKKIFPIIIGKGGMPIGGLRLVLSGNELKSASIADKPFSDDENYILITSDYLANGGDGLSFLSDNIRYLPTGLLMRDVIIEYIKGLTAQGKTINLKTDGRISYE